MEGGARNAFSCPESSLAAPQLLPLFGQFASRAKSAGCSPPDEGCLSHVAPFRLASLSFAVNYLLLKPDSSSPAASSSAYLTPLSPKADTIRPRTV